MNVIPASLSITNLETLKDKLDVLNPKLYTLQLLNTVNNFSFRRFFVSNRRVSHYYGHIRDNKCVTKTFDHYRPISSNNTSAYESCYEITRRVSDHYHPIRINQSINQSINHSLITRLLIEKNLHNPIQNGYTFNQSAYFYETDFFYKALTLTTFSLTITAV